MDDGLRRTLIDLAAEDTRVRAELAATGELFDGYHPRMEAVHAANARALEAVLGTGWPGVSRVGEGGAEAAWRIAQHAIGLPEFQRRCLALLETAVARGDAPPWQVAYLTDRIRTLEGRPQIYGTQFDWDAHGEMSPMPIEHEALVDARRAAVGLPPLADAIVHQRAEMAKSAETPPRDWQARKCEAEAWARKVGWRT